MFWGVVLTTSLLLAGTALNAAQTTAPSQGQQRRPSYEFADNGSSLSSPEAYRSGVDDGSYDRVNSSPALLRDRGWRDQQNERAYAAGYRMSYYGGHRLPSANGVFGSSGPCGSHEDNNNGTAHTSSLSHFATTRVNKSAMGRADPTGYVIAGQATALVLPETTITELRIAVTTTASAEEITTSTCTGMPTESHTERGTSTA